MIRMIVNLVSLRIVKGSLFGNVDRPDPGNYYRLHFNSSPGDLFSNLHLPAAAGYKKHCNPDHYRCQIFKEPRNPLAA